MFVFFPLVTDLFDKLVPKKLHFVDSDDEDKAKEEKEGKDESKVEDEGAKEGPKEEVVCQR